MMAQIKNPITIIKSDDANGYNSDIELFDLYANFLLDDYKIQQLYNGNYFINEEATNG